MELDFLINVELFSQLDENPIQCVKVIAVVASCGREMQDDEIIVSMISIERFMILIPLCE